MSGLISAAITRFKSLLLSSTGSSNIGHIASGDGAVSTTVQTKLRKIIHLNDKGITTAATAAANTTAMQNLIDEISAAGGGDIIADVGTYNFLALKPKNGVRILGIIGKTIFKLDNSAATNVHLFAHNTDGLDGSLDDFAMEGLILDANNKETCFLVFGCQRLRFTDVIFRNGGTYGCALQARPGFTIELPQDDVWFTRCGFEDNGSDSTWDGLDIKWCTHTKLIACWADNNTDVGINIRGREVDVIGCTTTQNGTSGMLFQSNHSSENSIIRVIGGGASGTTGGPGIDIQGDTSLNLYITIDGFQTYSNTGPGLRVSGSGKVYGTITGLESRSNTTDGVVITGDYVGHLVFNGGLILSNGGDGIDNTGKNCVFTGGMKIIGNTGIGYAERTGADNNYLMPDCIVSGNTGGNIGTRVGVETDDGFLAARTMSSIRVFPGQASGLELQTDTNGLYSALTAVGDATSIDLRLITKTNGTISGYKGNGGQQLFVFRQAGSATVNYLDFIASLTGTPVQVRASGSDTNIDLGLYPKGTGTIQLNIAHTTTSDTEISGYITVKDSTGTLRKLAVIT